MVPDVPGLLGFQLGQALRKLTKTYDQAFAAHGISPSQLLVLYHLWVDDGLQPKDLALRAHLDPTSANWLINQLEKAGLIERRRDSQDRRGVRIHLTEAGRSLQETLTPVVDRLHKTTETMLLEHLANGDLEALRRGLAFLVDRLPEGDDLWAEISRRWDDRIAKLRALLEEPAPKSTEGDDQHES